MGAEVVEEEGKQLPVRAGVLVPQFPERFAGGQAGGTGGAYLGITAGSAAGLRPEHIGGAPPDLGLLRRGPGAVRRGEHFFKPVDDRRDARKMFGKARVQQAARPVGAVDHQLHIQVIQLGAGTGQH